MISTRDGDWWVTSPLYVGDEVALMKMAVCKHEKFQMSIPGDFHTVPGSKDKIELGMEKCVGCGAVRSRYRYLDPERNKCP